MWLADRQGQMPAGTLAVDTSCRGARGGRRAGGRPRFLADRGRPAAAGQDPTWSRPHPSSARRHRRAPTSGRRDLRDLRPRGHSARRAGLGPRGSRRPVAVAIVSKPDRTGIGACFWIRRNAAGVSSSPGSPRSRPSRRPCRHSVRGHRLHRQARVLHQHHLRQPRLGLDRLERHRLAGRAPRRGCRRTPSAGRRRSSRDAPRRSPRPRRPPPSRRRSDRRSRGRPPSSPSCGCAPGSCAPRPIPARRRPWRPGRPSSRSRLRT